MPTIEAARHQFPFLVSVVANNSRSFGILISPEWVLTTATIVNHSSNADVSIGIYNLSGTEAEAVTIKVSADYINLHEKWQPLLPDNNIALLRLGSPATLSAAIQPVVSVDRTANPVGKTAKCVGWGLYLQNQVIRNTDTPQIVDATVVDIQKAITALGKNYNKSMHIAVDTKGSPYILPALIINGANGPQLVGLLNEGSFGGLAVYSSVDYFSEWIERWTGIGFY